ncbi:SRPBCC family protein, partial [Amycolatopsis japonica]
MGHEFEITDRLEVDATPEQVWDAIATGPGITSWFMGRNEVDGGVGGTVKTAFGGYEPTSAITSWDPLERLVYGTEPAPDGRFVAYEFLIEGRSGGSTVLRTVTSGFLPGDDWARVVVICPPLYQSFIDISTRDPSRLAPHGLH